MAILATVEQRFRTAPGVVDVRYLDPELRERIDHHERIAESHGAAGGLMAYKNRGVWEVLSRQFGLVLICDRDLVLNSDLKGVVRMMDPTGQVLGEYVDPLRKEQVLKEYPDAYFMSEDFVMYPDRKAQGEPYFLLDEMPVHDLDDIDHVTRVTSGSMTTLSDDIVRGMLGYAGPKMWTHMIGFDLRQ
jgi:hypothetical protein